MEWTRLGRAIAEARQAADMTQINLAAAIDVGISTIKTIEGGRPYTKIQPVHRMVARTLGWTDDSVDVVLAGGDPKPAVKEARQPETPTGPGRGDLLPGMPARAEWALRGSGRVVDADVIRASPGGGDGREIVMVFKADEGVSPEQLRRDMERWERLQRIAREILCDTEP